MGTQDNTSLETLIKQKGLNVGNEVLTAAGVKTAGKYHLATDSESKLIETSATTGALAHAHQSSTTGALPALKITQADTSEEAIRITGSATADVLTETLVAGATVTTATKAGFIRVNIQDDGNVMTDGNYYIQVYTIT